MRAGRRPDGGASPTLRRMCVGLRGLAGNRESQRSRANPAGRRPAKVRERWGRPGRGPEEVSDAGFAV